MEATRALIRPGQIHYITEGIRCCGAGTAADTEFTTALIASNMQLHTLSTGRKPRVVTAMTMLKQMLFRCMLSSSPQLSPC
jgi:20S proteasome alpha/beta subunit